MLQRRSISLCASLAGLGLAVSCLAVSAQDDSHHARKYKEPPAAARIQVTVLRDSNGKPIENAAVIFHPIQGDKDAGALEVKTNEDGKTIIDVIPIGDTVRMQIIASGFQTYGEDYKVDKEEITKEVRLKRPGRQYSIYPNGKAPSDNGQGSGGDKNQNPPKDSPPPDSKPKDQQSTPDAPK